MMRRYRYNYWITAFYFTLAIVTAALPMTVEAARSSSLSRWLAREAVPDIQLLLSRHPRYAGQRVMVTGGDADALAEAIATVLNSNLAGHDGIALAASPRIATLARTGPGSVDELDCRSGPVVDYLLQVTALRDEEGRGQVQLALLDSGGAGEQINSWQWSGSFTSGERAYLKKPAGPMAVNGSLGAPWSDRDVDAAAYSLSRDFACALRPSIETRLSLQWPGQTNLPDLFADTANTSRHLLGAYRELDISGDRAGSGESAAYDVDFRLERFRHDTWQLWLVGTPRLNALAPVQAVTYFRASDLNWPRAAAATVPAKAVPVPPPDLGNALDFIDVEVLDATQADLGNARAELQVTLSIGNRADWPIEYSFTLSGGHFNHCIARPGYYRHDHYGNVSGSVEAGARVVRRLVIDKAQHQPAPWFGTPRCAGFRDLDGFEEFASQGYKVTDFVRWDM